MFANHQWGGSISTRTLRQSRSRRDLILIRIGHVFEQLLLMSLKRAEFLVSHSDVDCISNNRPLQAKLLFTIPLTCVSMLSNSYLGTYPRSTVATRDHDLRALIKMDNSDPASSWLLSGWDPPLSGFERKK
jgi:hypothetical protein